MNEAGVTLIDVRHEAMDAIKRLKDGTLDLKTAGEIHKMLNVVIDVSKTQVEFLKAIPLSLREKLVEDDIRKISGTFRDKNEEIDQTIKQIELNNSKPYEFSKRP